MSFNKNISTSPKSQCLVKMTQLYDSFSKHMDKDDLSYERDADKVDPLSRYVNDEDI